MKIAMAPETRATGEDEKKEIQYSFTIRVKGVSQPQSDGLATGNDGWMISIAQDNVFLYPLDEEDFDGNTDSVLQDIFSRHRAMMENIARIGASREISLAIYYDASKITALCPNIAAVTIQRLAALNFALELCVFPSSFEDDEGTEK